MDMLSMKETTSGCFLAKVSTTSNIDTVRAHRKRCLYCSENRIQHNLLAVTPNEELMDCIHQCIYIVTKILEFAIVVLSILCPPYCFNILHTNGGMA